jgi:predicted transcriptional regulator
LLAALAAIPASSFAHDPVLTIASNATTKEALQAMQARGVSGAPVFDEKVR